jgi:hypothetical protein
VIPGDLAVVIQPTTLAFLVVSETFSFSSNSSINARKQPPGVSANCGPVENSVQAVFTNGKAKSPGQSPPGVANVL